MMINGQLMVQLTILRDLLAVNVTLELLGHPWENLGGALGDGDPVERAARLVHVCAEDELLEVAPGLGAVPAVAAISLSENMHSVTNAAHALE